MICNEINMASRDILRNALLVYVDNIMRQSFYWNVLRTNLFITDISELKVRLEIVFTQSRYTNLRSFRRIGMNKVIKRLADELGFKEKYKTDVEFREVQKTKKDNWNESVEYGDCYVRYLIPRELYDQLEMLAVIDKGDYIKSLSAWK